MVTFSDSLACTSGDLLRSRSGYTRTIGVDEIVGDSTGLGFYGTDGATSANGTWHKPNNQPTTNAQFAEAFIKLGSGGNFYALGVRCNTTIAIGGGYFVAHDTNARIRLMRRNDSGGLVALATYTHGNSTDYETNKVRLEAIGDQISVKFMGSTVIGPVTNAVMGTGEVAMLSRGGTATVTTDSVRGYAWGDIDTGTPVGLVTIAGTVYALAGVSIRPVGLATSTTIAYALNGVQIKPVGRVDVNDAAYALSGVVSSPVKLVTETNTVSALAGVQQRSVGLVTEATQALALASLGGGGVKLVQEATTAFALNGQSSKPVSRVDTTTTALALVAVQIGPVRRVDEVTTALGFSGVFFPRLVTETTQALALTGVQIVPVKLVTITDTVYALGTVQSGPVGLVVGATLALSLPSVNIKPVKLVVENTVAMRLYSPVGWEEPLRGYLFEMPGDNAIHVWSL